MKGLVPVSLDKRGSTVIEIAIECLYTIVIVINYSTPVITATLNGSHFLVPSYYGVLQCPPQVKDKAYWEGVAWVEPATTSKLLGLSLSHVKN